MLEMIILCGIPGSGKSTFTRSFPFHQRINQDMLGNRKDCENAAKRNLQQGKSVIIDRTNINQQQRKYFIDIAKDFGAKVYCVYLNVPVLECIERVKNRKEHETLSGLKMTEEKIVEIVNKFDKDFELPNELEGINEVFITNNVDADFLTRFNKRDSNSGT